MIVPIAQVIVSHQSVSRTSIRKMEAVLARQGQIEPLQVKVYSTDANGVTTYITFYQDAHGSDIVAAANNLGWPTLLVCVKSKSSDYEY